MFSAWPEPPPALCDSEMEALEAAGFHLTIASLAVPGDCFRLDPPASLKAEILYPPPLPVLELPLRSRPADAAWQAIAALAEEHARRGLAAPPDHREACAAWHCAREFRRRGIQHIHVRYAGALRVALYLRKTGLPFSFTFSGSADDSLLPEAVQEAEFVIVSGAHEHALLLHRCPDFASRIHLIQPGIDVSRYPAALCGEAGTLRMTAAARPASRTGLTGLLETMALLRERGIDSELKITGDSPWPALNEAAARLGLASCVHFYGPPDSAEAKRLLAASDVYLHLETGGSDSPAPGIMEAMATGLPVVAFDRPEAAELVAGGVTGWLVPPDDPAALMERLAVLAEDPALRAASGHAGLERIRQHFPLARSARRLAERFHASIGGRFAPAVTAGIPEVLCLIDMWPPAGDPVLEAELQFLSARADVEFVTASALSRSDFQAPPENMEFLPDAAVLEAVWRREHTLAARAAALRSVAGSTPGEDFFRAARRAVYLSVIHRTRRWRHVHALRSSSALWAWLLRRLTGLPASLVIEHDHARPPAEFAELAGGFTFGSVSDPAVSLSLPDILRVGTAASPRRLMGVIPLSAPRPPAEPAAVWKQWLSRIRSGAL